MGKKRILVLSGVHGTGKSTIGRAMVAQDRFSYYDEIGRRLRSLVSCNVTQSCFLFDREIMNMELERDRILLHDPCVPVVESWHIGNIAFALARNNTDVAHEYDKALQNRLQDFDPCVAVLRIDDETFLQRASEHGLTGQDVLSFYNTVETHIFRLIESFRLKNTLLDGTEDINYNVARLSAWMGSESQIAANSER